MVYSSDGQRNDRPKPTSWRELHNWRWSRVTEGLQSFVVVDLSLVGWTTYTESSGYVVPQSQSTVSYSSGLERTILQLYYWKRVPSYSHWPFLFTAYDWTFCVGIANFDVHDPRNCVRLFTRELTLPFLCTQHRVCKRTFTSLYNPVSIVDSTW